MDDTIEPREEPRPPRPNPDIVARRLDRAGVLVHLPTSRIFELNETGIRIWELLAAERTIGSVVDRLAGEFEIDAAEAARELDDLLVTFRREGLVDS